LRREATWQLPPCRQNRSKKQGEEGQEEEEEEEEKEKNGMAMELARLNKALAIA